MSEDTRHTEVTEAEAKAAAKAQRKADRAAAAARLANPAAAAAAAVASASPAPRHPAILKDLAAVIEQASKLPESAERATALRKLQAAKAALERDAEGKQN